MDYAVDNYNQAVEWGGQARPCGSSPRTRTTCRASCAWPEVMKNLTAEGFDGAVNTNGGGQPIAVQRIER